MFIIDWFKPKNRLTNVLLTEENTILYLGNYVRKGFSTDLKEEHSGEMGRSWGISEGNQLWDPENKEYVQLVSERDCTPLGIFGKAPVKITRAAMNRIAEKVTAEEINYARSHGKHNKESKWMGIVDIGLLCVLAYVIVAVVHAQGVF